MMFLMSRKKAFLAEVQKLVPYMAIWREVGGKDQAPWVGMRAPHTEEELVDWF